MSRGHWRRRTQVPPDRGAGIAQLVEGHAEEGPQAPSTADVLPDRAVPLGDEVEAFLAGRVVDHLVASHRPVPAWAVLNEVAHGTLDELTTLAALAGPAAGDPTWDHEEPHWRAAQRSLAADLLEIAPTPDEVSRIQRAVLVPLELWLIGRSRTETVSSRLAVEAASDALDTVRISP